MPPDAARAAEPFTGWLSHQHRLDVDALVVGAVMAVNAAAHWLASCHADRRALRHSRMPCHLRTRKRSHKTVRRAHDRGRPVADMERLPWS
jgi:hypothetical protein